MSALASKDRLISLTAVSQRYGGRTVLDQVDLAIDGGEIVTLIGPNGAGKTTLARIALGLIGPSQGQVWRRPGLRAGYLPQRLQIDRVLPLTVTRLLRMAAPSRATAGSKAVGEALAAVGGEALAARQMHDLSGGELQRVLLARALLRDPDLLVLDEPTQGVDVAGQAEMFRLIREVRDRTGAGVLVISHDLHVVMSASDQVLCINAHVCCAGTPESVVKHPEYIRLFGRRGAAELAIFEHDLGHHHDHHAGHDHA